MITAPEEVARYRVAEQVRAAERRAGRHERTDVHPSRSRHGLATALRRLADRLEPASRALTEPASRVVPERRPSHRGTGLSVVR